jgi:PAS domain S-box-containing protein
MRPTRSQFGYLIAIVGSLIVLGCRIALSQALGDQARLMMFLLPVMLSGWCGGLWPGAVATLFSLVLGLFYLVPPENSWHVETFADGLNAALFVTVGLVISYLCEALHAARQRETEKQFQTLANSIPQLVWMARPDGYRFWYNRRWHDYTGTTPSKVGGYDWQRFHDPAVLPRVLCSWKRALETGEPWQETYPLRRHDGQMRWHLARALPVRNEHGEIVCWFGTSTDVQDHVDIELTLKEADAKKDEFLATLAHELRNPLSAIAGAAQLFHLVDVRDPDLEKARDILDRQVARTVRLIDDLLDVSRITRNKLELKRECVDLAAVARQAIEAAWPAYQRERHELSIALPCEPIWLDADPVRLAQVLDNLLTNACKYTEPEGRISLVVEREGAEAVIQVKDNGLGISADLLPRVFDQFVQADPSSKRSAGGMGIGLSLAKRLVQMHGGTILARSDGPGRGSEFVVRLPALEQRSTTAEISAPSVPTVAVTSRRVLIVDDNVDSARMLAQVLSMHGHVTCEAHDGLEAADRTALFKPQVVLLDIGLPTIDGYEACRRIRQQPGGHDIVIAAVTGWGQAEDRRKSREAGFDEHFVKPVNYTAVERLLASFETVRT